MSKWFVAAAAAIAIVAIPVAIAASPSKNDQKPVTLGSVAVRRR